MSLGISSACSGQSPTPPVPGSGTGLVGGVGAGTAGAGTGNASSSGGAGGTTSSTAPNTSGSAGALGSAGRGGALGAGSSGANAGGAQSAGGVQSGGVSQAGASGGNSGNAGRGGNSLGGQGVGGQAGETQSAGGQSSAGSGGSAGKGGAAGGVSGAGASSGSFAGGATAQPSFVLGADISSVQESNTTFKDTDGQTKSIFALLKNHGFNYIRLKTFVDPKAPYGYASTSNGCTGLSEAFGDRDHVIAFGKQAKAEGMGFLLDFHYSDTWADPGNQIIPEAWRGAASITELAAFVKSYTKDVLSKAVQAGARPDMVQVGNEITPGLLAHVPGANTDCWGNNPQSSKVSGSTSNWANTATLLNAGIEAVREVDPTIQVMLHIENTKDVAGVKRWVDGARSHNVKFDILGLSCYTAFQGASSVWENTFKQMAAAYPDLKFAIAEYNPDRTRANLIIKNLPSGKGVGTFFWEPTRSGEWGSAMFTFQGRTATANTQDFAEYDALRPQLGL